MPLTRREIITEEDALYRRFLPYYLKEDGKLSSAAFKDSRKEPSVDLKRLTTINRSLDANHKQKGFGLAELSAGVPLRLGLEVLHAPVPENIAHCVIKGFENNENFSERQLQSNLADACMIVVKPKPRSS